MNLEATLVLESTSRECFFRAACKASRQWHPTPVLLPGKSHGRRSLVGCNPWGREESDMTEWLHFRFSLSCTGEGNATHSRVLAWRIPGTGEPGGLPSMRSHRVRHDWIDFAAAAADDRSTSRTVNPEVVPNIYGQLIFKKEFIWICSNEVDKTGAYCTEWSKPEKTPIEYTNAYIWNLERW